MKPFNLKFWPKRAYQSQAHKQVVGKNDSLESCEEILKFL